MGDKMASADMEGMSGMGGMSGCKGKQGGGMDGKSCCGDMHGGMYGGGNTASLEQRINELEKRPDLMQAHL